MEFVNRNPVIYVLSGKAGSGKSYVAGRMKSLLSERGISAIDIAYASYLKNYISNITGWDGNDDSKPRRFLQELGVELIKNQINDRLLIDRILDDIRVYSYFFDVIIVSDARFVDEINEIRNNFFRVVVINVLGRENNLSSLERSHSTETSLDGYSNYDFVIENFGDIDGKLLEVLK